MAKGSAVQQKPGFISAIMMLIIIVGGLFFMLFSADPTIDKMSKFIVWVFVYAVVHALYMLAMAFNVLGITMAAGNRIRSAGRGMAWTLRLLAPYWGALVVLIGISAAVRPAWWVAMNPLTLFGSVAILPYLIIRAANKLDAADNLRHANPTNTAGKAAQTAPTAGLIDTSGTDRPEPVEAIDTTATERPTESLADRIYQQPPEPVRLDLGPSPLRPDMPDVSGWDRDKDKQ